MRFSFFRKFKLSSPQGIALEILSIVIAIVLGFVVAEWREAKIEAKKSKVAIKRIAQEMERNQDGIQRLEPYYKLILARMDSIGTEHLNGPDEVLGWRGMSPLILQTSAYDIAIQTGILTHVDFEMAIGISLYYSACKDFALTSNYARQSLLLGQLETAQQYYTLLELFRQHCSVLNQLNDILQEDYFYDL